MADAKTDKKDAKTPPTPAGTTDWKAFGIAFVVFIVLALILISLFGGSRAPQATPSPALAATSAPTALATESVAATGTSAPTATVAATIAGTPIPTPLVRYCQPGRVVEGTCGAAGTTAEGKYCKPGQLRFVCDCARCPATTGPCASICASATATPSG